MTQNSAHRGALPPGHRLADYLIERVLGHDGFGITYLATDEHLRHAVAIKEYLPSDIAMREAGYSVIAKSQAEETDFDWGMERFMDEGRMLARFDHPNIVRIHRFFEAHGTAYIVMEYVEGETLAALLKRVGTLAEAELQRHVLPLVDGLREVHRAGFLHRDIKPGNVVICPDGSPVLVDFGSARQALGAKSRSVTAVVTPGYAPIEQYSTKGNQGPWTDLYALGAVLYRCVTGRTPEEAAERVIQDEMIPAARAAAGSYGRGLLAGIDALLAVRAEDRPQSLTAWREMLGGGAGLRGRRTAKGVAGAGAGIDGRDEERGLTPLHVAARYNADPAVIETLLSAGAKINARDPADGWTPLHFAARYNANPAVLETLLAAGASIDAGDYRSRTPLFLQLGAPRLRW